MHHRQKVRGLSGPDLRETGRRALTTWSPCPARRPSCAASAAECAVHGAGDAVRTT